MIIGRCDDRLMNRRFRDRAEAGQQLAQELLAYAKHPAAIVLGLPRGGVPVAYQIAKTLELPLDICLVHKLGVPGDPEVAMGAIDLQGNRWLNERIITELRIAPDRIDRVAESELSELHRRDRLYRGERLPVTLADRIVILVDDGLATGATMRSAIASIQPQQPAKIIVAVPVAFSRTADDLLDPIDLLVCLTMPRSMQSIGAWYEDFSQTSDAEVCELLARSTK
jgi:putative phosphoribosyl transferase